MEGKEVVQEKPRNHDQEEREEEKRKKKKEFQQTLLLWFRSIPFSLSKTAKTSGSVRF